MSAETLARLEPSPPGVVYDNLTHIACPLIEPDLSFCGVDITASPWTDPIEELSSMVICPECKRIDDNGPCYRCGGLCREAD